MSICRKGPYVSNTASSEINFSPHLYVVLIVHYCFLNRINYSPTPHPPCPPPSPPPPPTQPHPYLASFDSISQYVYEYAGSSHGTHLEKDLNKLTFIH